MTSIPELIKVAQSKGEPLFKWDEDRHPRDGNGRFADAVNSAVAADEASSRARRTDNSNEHARAARLHWRASRLALNAEDTELHAVAARQHDVRANK